MESAKAIWNLRSFSSLKFAFMKLNMKDGGENSINRAFLEVIDVDGGCS